MDKTLASQRLLPEARFWLLVRVCEAVRDVRPELLERYWPELQRLSLHLSEYPQCRPAYDELKASLKARGSEKKRSKFVLGILAAIEQGAALAAEDPEESRRNLEAVRDRLRVRRWLPFRTGEAWQALVLALARIDRRRALELVAEVPRGTRQSLIVRLNDGYGLSQSEWDALRQIDPSRTERAILDLLDRDVMPPRLSEALGLAVATGLEQWIFATPSATSGEWLEAERKHALERYGRLPLAVAGNNPDTGELLLEKQFAAIARTKNLFLADWLGVCALLSELLSRWAKLPGARERARSYFLEKCRKIAETDQGEGGADRSYPEHLRDFVLSHWAAMFPSNQTEAERAWEAERGSFEDPKSAEAWFLVGLVRRGLAQEALAMAQGSANAADLVPRLCRAILCELPDRAVSLVLPDDVADDPVGQFLLAGSTAARVEFLRERTECGTKALPRELWSRPGRGAVPRWCATRNAEPILYDNAEAPNNRFREVVRLNGYGRYPCEVTDPLLLAALVAWDEQHPDETRQLFPLMWKQMRPGLADLGPTLVREKTFQRCQGVLSANPDAFNTLFVQWVLKELVDQGQLNSLTPLRFCLEAAQKLETVSPARRDELIKLALLEYPLSEGLMDSEQVHAPKVELVQFAAKLYASDKGLAALDWLIPGKAFRGTWQIGIVEASRVHILRELESGQARAATA